VATWSSTTAASDPGGVVRPSVPSENHVGPASRDSARLARASRRFGGPSPFAPWRLGARRDRAILAQSRKAAMGVRREAPAELGSPVSPLLLSLCDLAPWRENRPTNRRTPSSTASPWRLGARPGLRAVARHRRPHRDGALARDPAVEPSHAIVDRRGIACCERDRRRETGCRGGRRRGGERGQQGRPLPSHMRVPTSSNVASA
jgi:hypothetical protein